MITLLILFSSTLVRKDKISDKAVVDYILKASGLSHPDSFRITNNLEFLYYTSNRFHAFSEYVIIDKFGKIKKDWIYLYSGYIKQPRPSIEEVYFEIFSIRLWLERQKIRLKRELLKESKPKPWVGEEDEYKGS